MTSGGTFLFSVDLEDVRDGLTHPERYSERVPTMTREYLRFLEDHQAKATFFVVGQVARRYPELIREIHTAGHEIACHSNTHTPLDKMTPEEFRIDLAKNLEALDQSGVSQVKGFRAPIASIIPSTAWAYPELVRAGITYSSSVLPGPNPLYGWPGFGTQPKLMDGVLEIPITLSPTWPKVPFAAGTYFRVLPLWRLKTLFAQSQKQQLPVISYFHPYDIDHEQDRFMHPGINDSHLFNILMYYNRKGLMKKLKAIMKLGFRITTYEQYLKESQT